MIALKSYGFLFKMVRQFVSGSTNGPIPGQTTFMAEFLQNSIVDFLIVNNIPENQLNPNADFSHDFITGTITRNNPWILGDKLIIHYQSCTPCGS